jgi:hypothetical protein
MVTVAARNGFWLPLRNGFINFGPCVLVSLSVVLPPTGNPSKLITHFFAKPIRTLCKKSLLACSSILNLKISLQNPLHNVTTCQVLSQSEIKDILSITILKSLN